MEKRFFHFFFIMVLAMLLWSHLAPEPPPDTAAAPTPATENVRLEQEIPTQQEPVLFAESPDKDSRTETVNNFSVTYSVTGGYVKSISVNGDEKPLPFRNIGALARDSKTVFTATASGNTIIFRSNRGREKEFKFTEDAIHIRFDPLPQEPYIVFSSYPDENPIDQRYQELFYSQNQNISRYYFTNRFFGLFGKGIKEGVYNNVEFAGSRDRYYCAALQKGEYTIEWDKVDYAVVENGKEAKRIRIDLIMHAPSSTVSLYVGPQKQENLQPFGLESVTYYGFFHGISIIMIKILNFFYMVTKNWGWSIVLFSISIYFTLFPFTAKSMKAMRKIQELQPELEALKEKYKDNPQKLQRESLEFYRKHKINPASGCLPLLFQMPVFLAMYQVIFRLFDLKGAQFLWIKDLSLPDRLAKLPFTVPILNTSDFNLLPLLVVALGLIQQKVTATSSGGAAASQQKSMGLFMTVFIGFIFYTFPSALVLYWFTQNIFTLAYQVRMSRLRLAAQ